MIFGEQRRMFLKMDEGKKWDLSLPREEQSAVLRTRALEREIERLLSETGIAMREIGKNRLGQTPLPLPEKEMYRIIKNIRFCESTTHPSQTREIFLKEALEKLLRSFRDECSTGECVPERVREKAKQKAKEEAKRILQGLAQIKEEGEIPLEGGAFISSDGTHDKGKLSQIDETLNEIKILAQGNEIQCDSKAAEKLFNTAFEKIFGKVGVFQDGILHRKFFDEPKEAAGHERKMILIGGEEFYYNWIDFDGAKRPEGIMYSVFAELTMADIRQGGMVEEDSDEIFNATEKEGINELYEKILKIGAKIHLLTVFLQKNGTKSNTLEAVMMSLKEKRQKAIKKLVTARDKMVERRKEQGKEKIKLLSKRVRFIPRIDNEFLQALKRRDTNGVGERESDKRKIETLGHIIDQIIEINDFSPQGVAEIIIAQAGIGDVQILEKFIDERLKGKGIEKGSEKDTTQDVAICPLFETKKTTSPKYIRGVLINLWNYYAKGKGEKGKEEFERKIIEFFFAGSDLSKSIGQASAIARVWGAAIAVEEFNIEYDTDIRIKLGSGEAFFRQLGFFDKEAYLPAVRAKVFDPNLEEKEVDEKSEISERVDFFEEQYGTEWKLAMRKEPSGAAYLLRTFPWINSITTQSKSREFSMEMSATQLIRFLEELKGLKQERIPPKIKVKKWRKKRVKDWKNQLETYKEYSDPENELYEEVIGKEIDSFKPDGNLSTLPAIIELCAKTLMPKLRARGLAREGGEHDSPEVADSKDYFALSKSGINARCIGANAVSNFIFPLGLLGKGISLKKAKDSDKLNQIIPFLNLKALLREIKRYEPFAKKVFALMRENSAFRGLANTLEKEWNGILEVKKDLQEAYLQKISTRETLKFTSECENLDAFAQQYGYEIVYPELEDEEIPEKIKTDRKRRVKISRERLYEIAKRKLGTKSSHFDINHTQKRELFITSLPPGERELVDSDFTSREIEVLELFFDNEVKGVLKGQMNRLSTVDEIIDGIFVEKKERTQNKEAFLSIEENKQYIRDKIREALSGDSPTLNSLRSTDSEIRAFLKLMEKRGFFADIG